MTDPITPAEAARLQAENLPDAVFEAFNDLILKSTNGIVYQDDAVEAISAKLLCTERAVLDNGWLDIEYAYRAKGWDVEYHKPAYNETGRAYFTFKPTK